MPGALGHSPAEIIRQLLVDLSHATLPSADGSWPAYVSREPNTPDSVITVYDTAGQQQGRIMVSGERQEAYGLQIRVRDPDHQGGYEKSQQIAIGLDGVTSITVVTLSDVTGTGQTQYKVWNVSRKTNVFSIGKESPMSKRNIFTINAVAILRQVS